MRKLILAINPGSTSTKIGLFSEDAEIFKKSIAHDSEDLKAYPSINAQTEYRAAFVHSCLKKNNVPMNELVAVVGRGGMLPPVKSGGYIVNEAMKRLILEERISQHASNLGALLAAMIAEPLNIPAFIYDAVSVDELIPIARITGFPEIVRHSFCHALNSRAMARQYANSCGKRYEDVRCIVAHLGGGITVSAHQNAKIIDSMCDDDGAFAPERSGGLSLLAVIDLCFDGTHDKKSIQRKIRGDGGLKALLGTSDCQEIENRITRGDERAKEVYTAMAYQISKGICVMAPALQGQIDAVILTGGCAHSSYLVELIKGFVGFLAPIHILPGEFELEAMAAGARRIINHEEEYSALEE